MQRTMAISLCTMMLMLGTSVYAQDAPAEPAPASDDTKSKAGQIVDSAKDKAGVAIDTAEHKAKQYAEQIDQSEKANKISAGILQPIYDLAEKFSFPAFHWIAFSLMAMGVVSWALQLVLGKLVVLARGGFSMSEIISDAVVLAISVVGLVLTTQAAAENSTFTQTASSVLSATGVGSFFGFILYWWGQRQELQAVEGRTKAEGKKERE